MTLREFYLERRRAEVPTFVKVLKALPDDRLSYRPHDRSPSAEQIVWTLTSELRACLDAATHFKAEWKVEPSPPLPDWLFRYHLPVVIKLGNPIPRSLVHLGDDIRQFV